MARKIFNAVSGGVGSILGLGSKSAASAPASPADASKATGPIIKQLEARTKKKTAARTPSQVQSILRDTLGGD